MVVVAKGAEPLLNILVRYLCLAVDIRVIRRRKLYFSPEDIIILLSKGGDELRSSV